MIDHPGKAAFIGSKQLGYSFEALGEDIGNIRDTVGGTNGIAAAIRGGETR